MRIISKINDLEFRGNYSATSNNNYEVGTLAVTFGTARRRLGRLPSSLYTKCNRAHPSTASVPITVLLYNGPLLCGFNVPVKGINKRSDLLQLFENVTGVRFF